MLEIQEEMGEGGKVIGVNAENRGPERVGEWNGK